MGYLPLTAWRGRSEPGQAVAVWLRGRCQIGLPSWLLASRQRRAMMASAPATVQLHAGQFEALADDRLAACLDDAGADEQAAGAEPLVAHAGRVVLEVAQRLVQPRFLDADEGVGAGGGADAVDVAVVQVLQAGGEPLLCAGRRA